MTKNHRPETEADQKQLDQDSSSTAGPRPCQAMSIQEIAGQDRDEQPPARRSFLSAVIAGLMMAVAGIVTSLGGKLTLANVNNGPNNNRRKQYGMVIDVRRCIGCHACSVAFKSEFDRSEK